MKISRVILLATAVLLFLSAGAAGHPAGCDAQQGVASGGGYRLAGGVAARAPDAAWLVSGTASGGGYRLSAVTAPAGTGSGCCCTYQPCTLRGYRP